MNHFAKDFHHSTVVVVDNTPFKIELHGIGKRNIQTRFKKADDGVTDYLKNAMRELNNGRDLQQATASDATALERQLATQEPSAAGYANYGIF